MGVNVMAVEAVLDLKVAVTHDIVVVVWKAIVAAVEMAEAENAILQASRQMVNIHPVVAAVPAPGIVGDTVADVRPLG